MRTLNIGLLTGLFACGETDKPEIEEEVLDTGVAVFDLDGDGYFSDEDCDDNSSAIFPNAEELCDGVDNDCDGEIDEGVLSTFYLDVDQDGFGDDAAILEACEVRDGYVAIGNDCDDGNVAVFPSAPEVCDEVDNNCDGQVDEDVQTAFFTDRDGDGYGSDDSIEWACAEAEGLVSVSGDCDDSNAVVNPGADEVCDGLDNNCSGTIDEGQTQFFYEDVDGDGFGSENGTIETCNRPMGYVDNALDCDDTSAFVSPLATEVCDTVDNNCDGVIDEDGALGSTAWYLDADSDGYGSLGSQQMSCEQPAGYVSNSSDCNDADAAFSPIAAEICDGFDNDCDGAIDDADGNVVTANVWYLDHDTDGYGDPLFTLSACNQPSNYVANSDDCDDFNFASSPESQEICDGIDNDCDGSVDDFDSNVVYSNGDLYHQDLDGDGFGDVATSSYTCSPTSSMVVTAGDCNDMDASISPNAAEECDGIDNNCDGSTDGADAIDQTMWYQDLDADGHGNDAVSLEQCDQPTDYIDNNTDCDDDDITINPDEFDTCDGIDNDCDGVIDEDEGLGSTAACAATSCMEILTDDPTAEDGVYFIQDANGNPIEAYCEMDFDGGGWLVVYNFPLPGNSNSDAATMHSSLIQNGNMNIPLEPTVTSTAISTTNIPLEDYQDVVYGWAPGPDGGGNPQDVTHYGMSSDGSGLTGACYLDGYCGAGTMVGDFYISTSGNTRTIYTGNSPTYPHVGLGYSGQIIVWGFDNNSSSYGHWANWYDGNPCCNAGNTSDISGGAGRYVIYIR